MKMCIQCGLGKSEKEFSWRSRPKDQRVSKCKPCQREYTNAHYQANRDKRREQLAASNRSRQVRIRAVVREIKASCGCVDCGERDPIVLEFDHLRDKEFNIGDHAGRIGLDRLMEEIAKCEVVCANCHRRRTHCRLSAIGSTPLL